MFKFIGILTAAILIAILFGGYFAMRHRQIRQTASDSHTKSSAEPIEPVKLYVFEDEAYLKKSQAIIGGTVENVSAERLSQLALTIKLLSKDGQREELKTVPLTPSELDPGARAKYVLAVPHGKWRGTKVVNVISMQDAHEYAFKSSRGNVRPREQSPAQARTIVVKKPSPNRGEEFLNTPDNPIPIR